MHHGGWACAGQDSAGPGSSCSTLGSGTLGTADSGGDEADVGKVSSGEGQESAHKVNCVQEPRYEEESLHGKGLPELGRTKTCLSQDPSLFS